jgi:hypothetical protein
VQSRLKRSGIGVPRGTGAPSTKWRICSVIGASTPPPSM